MRRIWAQMERARSQDDVSQNFSAAAAGKCAQKPSQQGLQMVPVLEQQRLRMGYLGAGSSRGRSSWQASSSQRDRKWLSGGGGSGLFALYWAEVRPSVKRVTLSERAKVHILSLDADAFNIPSLGGKKAKSGNFGVPQFWWNVLFFPDFSI